MTDLHAAFLQKIQASEGDSLRTAQGIYADWLEEQGDPRAELLRLAVEIRGFRKNKVLTERCYLAGDYIQKEFWLGKEVPRLLEWMQSAKMPVVKHRLASTIIGFPVSEAWIWGDRTIPLMVSLFQTERRLTGFANQ